MIRIAPIQTNVVAENNHKKSKKMNPSFGSSKEEMATIILEKNLGKRSFFALMTNYIGEIQKAFSGLKGGDSFVTADLTRENVLPNALSGLRVFSKKTPFKTFGEFNTYMNQPFNPDFKDISRKEQLNELLKIYGANEPDTIVVNKLTKPTKRCTLCEKKEKARLTEELSTIEEKLQAAQSRLGDAYGQELYMLNQDSSLLNARKSQILTRIEEINTK